MKMQFADVDGGNTFDWGQSAQAYAKYRDIYPSVFYERAFLEQGLGLSGQTCLDLGTGTGVLPRAMYPHGAHWFGVDVTKEQIDHAQRLAAEQHMQIDFRVAPAEETGFADASFDVISACQCFGYFDKARVLPEIARMLKPDGRFLALYMAWLPSESAIAAASERLVLEYNPAWSGGGFQRETTKVPAWAKPYFTCVRCENFAVDIPFTRESWDGRMYACRGVGAAALSDSQKAEFRRRHQALLANFPPQFQIPHWVSILDLKKAPADRKGT